MKKCALILQIVIFSIFILIRLSLSQNIILPVVKDMLNSTTPGAIQFGGHFGELINKIIDARFNSEFVKSTIYPEAINAFRERIDVRKYQGMGFWQGEF